MNDWQPGFAGQCHSLKVALRDGSIASAVPVTIESAEISHSLIAATSLLGQLKIGSAVAIDHRLAIFARVSTTASELRGFAARP